MEENQEKIKLLFSFTDDMGETTTLEKNFNDSDEIGTLPWLLDEFKYFLHSMSFNESLTNNIVFLEEKGDKVVDANGEVIYERK